MYEVRQLPGFRDWHVNLSDRKGAKTIAQRIVRLESGLFGDIKFFSGIGELKIDVGPGYRVYFCRRHRRIILLLCGGDKSTQRGTSSAQSNSRRRFDHACRNTSI